MSPLVAGCVAWVMAALLAPAAWGQATQPAAAPGVRAHDPSAVVRSNGGYWFFATGPGVRSYRSKDLQSWTPGPRVFAEGQAPGWVRDEVPQNRGGQDFWAPDVIRAGERYLLYYSVSSWGKNTSVIALASNRALDPEEPGYRWVDEGVVVRSRPGDDFNAIDPAVTLDAEGRLWMSFGSFWGGIKLIELDAATGKRIAADSPIYSLARAKQIEAPHITRHGGRYYLLLNWGLCCRGTSSTYNIRVGRAERITGPYLDRDGRDMNDGGGTLLLGSEGDFIGPGHPSIFEDAQGRSWMACHYYDGAQRGRATFALRALAWDADGWPVIGEPLLLE